MLQPISAKRNNYPGIFGRGTCLIGVISGWVIAVGLDCPGGCSARGGAGLSGHRVEKPPVLRDITYAYVFRTNFLWTFPRGTPGGTNYG